MSERMYMCVCMCVRVKITRFPRLIPTLRDIFTIEVVGRVGDSGDDDGGDGDGDVDGDGYSFRRDAIPLH